MERTTDSNPMSEQQSADYIARLNAGLTFTIQVGTKSWFTHTSLFKNSSVEGVYFHKGNSPMLRKKLNSEDSLSEYHLTLIALAEVLAVCGSGSFCDPKGLALFITYKPVMDMLAVLLRGWDNAANSFGKDVPEKHRELWRQIIIILRRYGGKLVLKRADARIAGILTELEATSATEWPEAY